MLLASRLGLEWLHCGMQVFNPRAAHPDACPAFWRPWLPPYSAVSGPLPCYLPGRAAPIFRCHDRASPVLPPHTAGDTVYLAHCLSDPRTPATAVGSSSAATQWSPARDEQRCAAARGPQTVGELHRLLLCWCRAWVLVFGRRAARGPPRARN